MGYEMFIVLLNMSLTGAVVILAVLAVRLLLRRAPKVISYCLWAVVLFKLLCPVSFSLPVPLPETENGPVVESGIVYYIPKDILYGQPSAVEPAAPVFSEKEGNAVPSGGTGSTVLSGRTEEFKSGEGRKLTGIAMAVWGVGVVLMLTYAGGSMAVLKGKLKKARPVGCAAGAKTRITVYEKENLPTPFVLGIIRPKIYLPTGLKKSEKQYILLHEQIHIRRGDHIVKAVSFLTLCIHWFNPMVWAAFFLSERDMEMSCDEAVLRKLGSGVKKDYSAALLNLAAGRRIIGGMPLAFGEGTPGSRIRNVLKYKKPQLAAVCAGIVLAVTAAVLLMANPQQGSTGDEEGSSRGQESENAESGADISKVSDEAGIDGDPSQSQEGETTDAAPNSSADAGTGADTDNGQEPEGAISEKNRELRAMERGEAFTWETLQKLMEEPVPLLESYAGYEGAVWDDMGGRALNRYLIYDLRDEEKEVDYQLMVSYMAEDDHVDMVYLLQKRNMSELGLYLEKTGWRDADIEEFREHLPALSDWIAEYRIPQEEKLQADVFSMTVGSCGGQTFQWVGTDEPAVITGEWCPEEWKAAAAIFRMDGESFVFDTGGTLTDVMLWSNHSSMVTEPIPVEGCEEQAVLFEFECDLFTLPEFEEAKEAGTVISEEDITGHFWYVCFGREGAPYGYAVSLNMCYFSEEEAVEFAKSIRFTEEAWR